MTPLAEAIARVRDLLMKSSRDVTLGACPEDWRALRLILAAAEEAEGLRAALTAIANARPSQWEPDVRDQFQQWAQNIAARALTGEKE